MVLKTQSSQRRKDAEEKILFLTKLKGFLCVSAPLRLCVDSAMSKIALVYQFSLASRSDFFASTQ